MFLFLLISTGFSCSSAAIQSPTQEYFSQQFNQCFSCQKQEYVTTLINEFYLQDLIDTIQAELKTLDANPDFHLKNFEFMSKLYTKIRNLRHGIPLYRNEERIINQYNNERKNYDRYTAYIPIKLEKNFPISESLKKLEKSMEYFFYCARKGTAFKQALKQLEHEKK